MFEFDVIRLEDEGVRAERGNVAFEGAAAWDWLERGCSTLFGGVICLLLPGWVA